MQLVDLHSPHKTQKKTRKEINRRVHRAESMENQTWAEFEARVNFLKRYKYIAEDGTFYAGAKILDVLSDSRGIRHRTLYDWSVRGTDRWSIVWSILRTCGGVASKCLRIPKTKPSDARTDARCETGIYFRYRS